MKNPSSAGLATASPAIVATARTLETYPAFGNRTARHYSRPSRPVVHGARDISVSRVAIITGGSRGIGKAAALAAAAAGYDVAISYRQDGDAADAVVQRVRAQGRRGLAVAADS